MIMAHRSAAEGSQGSRWLGGQIMPPSPRGGRLAVPDLRVCNGNQHHWALQCNSTGKAFHASPSRLGCAAAHLAVPDPRVRGLVALLGRLRAAAARGPCEPRDPWEEGGRAGLESVGPDRQVGTVGSRAAKGWARPPGAPRGRVAAGAKGGGTLRDVDHACACVRVRARALASGRVTPGHDGGWVHARHWRAIDISAAPSPRSAPPRVTFRRPAGTRRRGWRAGPCRRPRGT
jgi:hypothetical protein